MPHHKRAAAPQISLPSIRSLLCFERSALASSTRPGTCGGKIALAHRRNRTYSTYNLCVHICLIQRFIISIGRHIESLKHSLQCLIINEPPRTKPPSPPILPYCALSVLLLRRAHVQAHVLERVLLHIEHSIVTADLSAFEILTFKLILTYKFQNFPIKLV